MIQKKMTAKRPSMAVFFWLFAAITVFAAIIFFFTGHEVVIAFSVAGAAVVAAILFGAINYRIDSICGLALVSFFAYYPLAAFLNLLLPIPSVRWDLWKTTDWAMAGFIVGGLSFAIGLKVGAVLVPNSAPRVEILPKRSLTICLTAICVPIVMLMLATGQYFHRNLLKDLGGEQGAAYGYILHIFQWISFSGSFLQLFRYSKTGEKKDLVLLICLVLFELGAFIPSGNRTKSIMMVIILLVFYASWFPFSMRKLLVILSLVAGVAATGAFMESYRYLGVGTQDIGSRVQLASASISEDDLWLAPVGRLSSYVATGKIIERTPESNPYRGLELLDRLDEVFIPGFLVPRQFEQAVTYSASAAVSWNYGVPESIDGTYAVTLIGDLFSRAGWLAVLFGMLLSGALLRIVEGLTSRGQSVFRIIFLALFGFEASNFYAFSLIDLIAFFSKALVIEITLTMAILYLAKLFKMVEIAPEAQAVK